MHLVFIQKAAGRGGAKNRLLETLSALKDSGRYQLSVVTGEDGEFHTHCHAMGIRPLITTLPEWRKPLERLRFPGAMRVVAGKLEPASWVISNEMWWAPHAAALARHLGGKSGCIIRDGICTAEKARKYAMQRLDLLLPSSTKIGDGLRLDPALDPKVQVFYDSVQLPKGAGALAAELDAALATAPSVRRWLLIIGKVGKRKNQADAVRVLQALRQAGHEDLGLLLAGDEESDYVAEMDRVIAETGQTGRVLRLGNFTDIGSLFARAHAVMLTSTREGLPGSVVESLLAGKPCFVFPCEGVSDIYGGHLARFVAPVFEPQPLVDVILRAWQDEAGTSAAVHELQLHAERTFSPTAHLARMDELFIPG